jgi:signal transduction histidine kinase
LGEQKGPNRRNKVVWEVETPRAPHGPPMASWLATLPCAIVHPDKIGSFSTRRRAGGGSVLQPVRGVLWRDMEIKAPSSTAATSIAIVTVALAIFVVDMLVHVDIAIPILYVAVVLMSVRLYGVRGVVIVSLGCILLTVVGYLLSPGNLFGTTAVANRFLALLAIGATTFLALKDRAAQVSLDKAQADLAHVTRVTTLGELTASIAHEVNQPLAAVIASGEACVRWLDREVPDLDEARDAAESIINDGKRAGEVIQRVRALAKKTDTERRPLDINDLVTEVIALLQRELLSNGVSLRIELVRALPMVLADRVQLQQVIINLIMNGIEAMQPVTDRPRELVIRSHQDAVHQVLVTVKDSGVGISAHNADRLFSAFFTTKSGGMGMGLSICRSIIEAHGGRLSGSGNVGPGATFQFALPTYRQTTS